MCLGIPGRIEEIRTPDETGMRMGRVNFGGVARDVSLSLVADAQVGDYVLVHVGFAIGRLDEEEARQTLALFREMGLVGEATVSPTEGEA